MTVIPHSFYAHDSLLLFLEPAAETSLFIDNLAKQPSIPDRNGWVRKDLSQPSGIILSEPNVLLLDMAEYSFDSGPWQPREEILRIDNLFRRELGFPRRDETLAQPWTLQEEGPAEHTLSLRYTFDSDIDVTGAHLALENPLDTEIIVNGEQIDVKVDGWFTDESIKRVPLPDLPAGENVIILRIPFAVRTNVEWCYLLGDFGVEVTGRFQR